MKIRVTKTVRVYPKEQLGWDDYQNPRVMIEIKPGAVVDFVGYLYNYMGDIKVNTPFTDFTLFRSEYEIVDD